MEETIGSRLKAWRNTLGITQAHLADRLGVHIGVLKKYEQGINVPGGEYLAAIAKTGVNMAWLLTGEGEMRSQTSAESTFSSIPLGRRWEKIITLVESIDDETRRAAVLDELFSLAQKESELVALRKAVADIKKRITT